MSKIIKAAEEVMKHIAEAKEGRITYEKLSYQEFGNYGHCRFTAVCSDGTKYTKVIHSVGLAEMFKEELEATNTLILSQWEKV